MVALATPGSLGQEAFRRLPLRAANVGDGHSLDIGAFPNKARSTPDYRLEARHQAASQPNKLNAALALPLQTPARLYSMEISVEVNLQQRRRMMGRPSRHLWLGAAKA